MTQNRVVTRKLRNADLYGTNTKQHRSSALVCHSNRKTIDACDFKLWIFRYCNRVFKCTSCKGDSCTFVLIVESLGNVSSRTFNNEKVEIIMMFDSATKTIQYSYTYAFTTPSYIFVSIDRMEIDYCILISYHDFYASKV